MVGRTGRALGVVVLGLAALGAGPVAAAPLPHECVVIGTLGGPPVVSDPTECARPTAPASTFKIPHALIALQTGVITPATVVEWDGTRYWSAPWQRSHTVDSAVKWSVLPFFQRTARLIGRERMRQGLTSLDYAADTFDGDINTFWLTGDLAVTPLEQYGFLQRFFAGRLPIDATHVATVRRALEMPTGQITNASGTHRFTLTWPGPLMVRAKTGNTTVDGEQVSWLVGAVESRGREVVVVARVRAPTPIEGTVGLTAALSGLETWAGRPRP